MSAEHGTAGARARHYRDKTPVCEECKAGHRKRMRRYRKMLTLGHKMHVPVKPILRHVESLGMSQKELARASGLPIQTITGLRRRKRVTPATARALLAVGRARPHEMAPASFVDALGSARRLQALAWRGWSFIYLAERMDTSVGRLSKIANGITEKVHAETAAAIMDIFDQLADKEGPSARARVHARRQGWPPAAAWDDIDDPKETPKL